MLQVKTEKNYEANSPQMSDHTHKILITGGSGSGKTNALLHLESYQPVIVKIYLYAKNPHKAKYKLLIKKCKSVGSKHCNDPESFTEHSNDMMMFMKILINTLNRNKNPKY